MLPCYIKNRNKELHLVWQYYDTFSRLLLFEDHQKIDLNVLKEESIIKLGNINKEKPKILKFIEEEIPQTLSIGLHQLNPDLRLQIEQDVQREKRYTYLSEMKETVTNNNLLKNTNRTITTELPNVKYETLENWRLKIKNIKITDTGIFICKLSSTKSTRRTIIILKVKSNFMKDLKMEANPYPVKQLQCTKNLDKRIFDDILLNEMIQAHIRPNVNQHEAISVILHYFIDSIQWNIDGNNMFNLKNFTLISSSLVSEMFSSDTNLAWSELHSTSIQYSITLNDEMMKQLKIQKTPMHFKILISINVQTNRIITKLIIKSKEMYYDISNRSDRSKQKGNRKLSCGIGNDLSFYINTLPNSSLIINKMKRNFDRMLRYNQFQRKRRMYHRSAISMELDNNQLPYRSIGIILCPNFFIVANGYCKTILQMKHLIFLFLFFFFVHGHSPLSRLQKNRSKRHMGSVLSGLSVARDAMGLLTEKGDDDYGAAISDNAKPERINIVIAPRIHQRGERKHTYQYK
ncbi:hypothetical protein SNEBB_005356 [Seison nebaliae]|nr:hypothetical protein SNEBB_005356 [Seison nebaliae]